MFRHAVTVQQGHALLDDARRSGPRPAPPAPPGRRDHAGGGEDAFDLASHVSDVPARTTGPESSEHHRDHRVTVDPADGGRTVLDAVPRALSATRARAAPRPTADANCAPLVGTTLSGRASDQARRSQTRRSRLPGSSPGCSARHCALVPVDVPGDLAGAGAEFAGVRDELADLPASRRPGSSRGTRGPAGTPGRTSRRRARSR